MAQPTTAEQSNSPAPRLHPAFQLLAIALIGVLAYYMLWYRSQRQDAVSRHYRDLDTLSALMQENVREQLKAVGAVTLVDDSMVAWAPQDLIKTLGKAAQGLQTVGSVLRLNVSLVKNIEAADPTSAEACAIGWPKGKEGRRLTFALNRLFFYKPEGPTGKDSQASSPVLFSGTADFDRSFDSIARTLPFNRLVILNTDGALVFGWQDGHPDDSGAAVLGTNDRWAKLLIQEPQSTLISRFGGIETIEEDLGGRRYTVFAREFTLSAGDWLSGDCVGLGETKLRAIGLLESSALRREAAAFSPVVMGLTLLFFSLVLIGIVTLRLAGRIRPIERAALFGAAGVAIGLVAIGVSSLHSQAVLARFEKASLKAGSEAIEQTATKELNRLSSTLGALTELAKKSEPSRHPHFTEVRAAEGFDLASVERFLVANDDTPRNYWAFDERNGARSTPVTNRSYFSAFLPDTTSTEEACTDAFERRRPFLEPIVSRSTGKAVSVLSKGVCIGPKRYVAALVTSFSVLGQDPAAKALPYAVVDIDHEWRALYADNGVVATGERLLDFVDESTASRMKFIAGRIATTGRPEQLIVRRRGRPFLAQIGRLDPVFPANWRLITFTPWAGWESALVSSVAVAGSILIVIWLGIGLVGAAFYWVAAPSLDYEPTINRVGWAAPILAGSLVTLSCLFPRSDLSPTLATALSAACLGFLLPAQSLARQLRSGGRAAAPAAALAVGGVACLAYPIRIALPTPGAMTLWQEVSLQFSAMAIVVACLALALISNRPSNSRPARVSRFLRASVLLSLFCCPGLCWALWAAQVERDLLLTSTLRNGGPGVSVTSSSCPGPPSRPLAAAAAAFRPTPRDPSGAALLAGLPLLWVQDCGNGPQLPGETERLSVQEDDSGFNSTLMVILVVLLALTAYAVLSVAERLAYGAIPVSIAKLQSSRFFESAAWGLLIALGLVLLLSQESLFSTLVASAGSATAFARTIMALRRPQ